EGGGSATDGMGNRWFQPLTHLSVGCALPGEGRVQYKRGSLQRATGGRVPAASRLNDRAAGQARESALARLVISMISVVMADWRARLYFRRRSRRSSSAFDVALSIATMRAPCSAAFDSSSTRQSW